MSQESSDRLVNFIREAFGARCAELLLVGLGEETVRGTKEFYIPDTEESAEWEVEIEVVGGSLPCRSEPLVLAALLKLLLGREGIPSPLEFQMSEVVDELQRAGVAPGGEDVDRTISKYAALSYEKRVRGAGRADERGGVYSLVASYLRGSVKGAGETIPAHSSRGVIFEQSLIEGLRRGEVVVAGIRFGGLGEAAR